MRFRLTNRSHCLTRQHPSRPGWMRNEDGTAAIEFGIVALPFLMFVIGLLGLGLYFLAGTQLEYGVEAAARKVRTGEAKKDSMTVGMCSTESKNPAKAEGLVSSSGGLSPDFHSVSRLRQPYPLDPARHRECWVSVAPFNLGQLRCWLAIDLGESA